MHKQLSKPRAEFARGFLLPRWLAVPVQDNYPGAAPPLFSDDDLGQTPGLTGDYPEAGTPSKR
jgi:hypothetical protein